MIGEHDLLDGWPHPIRRPPVPRLLAVASRIVVGLALLVVAFLLEQAHSDRAGAERVSEPTEWQGPDDPQDRLGYGALIGHLDTASSRAGWRIESLVLRPPPDRRDTVTLSLRAHHDSSEGAQEPGTSTEDAGPNGTDGGIVRAPAGAAVVVRDSLVAAGLDVRRIDAVTPGVDGTLVELQLGLRPDDGRRVVPPSVPDPADLPSVIPDVVTASGAQLAFLRLGGERSEDLAGLTAVGPLLALSRLVDTIESEISAPLRIRALTLQAVEGSRHQLRLSFEPRARAPWATDPAATSPPMEVARDQRAARRSSGGG